MNAQDYTGIVVYTAILGNYDDLSAQHGSANAFCFTDISGIESDTWQIVRMPPCWATTDERVRAARRLKLLPHCLFPKADVWIWIDAALKLHTDPRTLISYLGDEDIATFAYPAPRNCLFQEAEACILREKDNQDVISAHMARYRAEGYPPHSGLVETTAMVRRNTDRCRAFNEMWWSELEQGSRRDQLSFNYVSWKLQIPYSLLPGSRLSNPFGTWAKHKENIYGK